jgi:hypothetical protein
MAAALNDRTTAAALVAIADDFSAEADQLDPTLKSTSLESISRDSGHRPTSGGCLSGGRAADDPA